MNGQGFRGVVGRKLSRRDFLRGSATTGMGLMAAGSISCRPQSPSGSTGIEPSAGSGQPRHGGTFRTVTTVKAPHRDVHQAATLAVCTYGVGMCYSGLLRTKTGPGTPEPSGIPHPDLAESWEQPDDLTYIFKLRQGVMFHKIPPVNGREAVAEDVVYSFNRQRTPGFPNSSYLAGVSKIEALDRYRVKITLSEPDADFLQSVSDARCKVIAHEVVEQYGDLKQAPVIGTGPWIFDKEEPDSLFTAVRNPEYFLKPLPYADRIEIYRMVDYTAQFTAFRAKQVDYFYAGITKQMVDTLKGIPELTINTAPSGYSGNPEILLQCSQPPFSDVRVRQAFMKAIDRQAMIQVLYAGDGEYGFPISTLPAADWLLAQDELGKYYKRDIPEARRLLAAAGYGNGLTVESIVPSTGGDVFKTAAELAVAHVKEAGIDLRLKIVDTAEHSQQVTLKGDYQVAMGTSIQFNSTNAELLSRFHSKGSRHTFRLNDPQLDRMVEEQARMGKDPEARKKLVKDIQRRVLDQAVPQTNVRGRSYWVMWPHVKNFSRPGTLYEGFAFAELWIDG